LCSLALIGHGDVGGYTAEEADQAGSACITEIFIGVENILEAF
jgi:hypothetical protein